MTRYWPYAAAVAVPVPFGVQAGATVMVVVWLAVMAVIGGLMVRADRIRAAREVIYPYTYEKPKAWPDLSADEPADETTPEPLPVAVPGGSTDAEAQE